MTNKEQFIKAYESQYGPETASLIQALLSYDEKIALINPFIEEQSVQAYLKTPLIDFMGQKICQSSLKPERISGLLSHYFLDRSSLLAPLLLPLRPGMKILDMCSAPGGKLLAMIFRGISDLSFVANDLSAARSNRLKKVILDYVPQHIPINFAAKDGSLIGLKQPGLYDAVLLDAPCSSEAHVIKDPGLLAKFKGLRKTLPHRQYALLCSAIMATKKGGHIMYATCSINQNENEDIIARILKKKSDHVKVLPLNAPLGRITPWGVSILPHEHQAGPAFLSLLEKI